MEIIVGPEICLVGIDQEYQDKLKELCTGANPEFGTWERTVAVRPGLRYSKKYPQPPRYLNLFRWDDKGNFIVPRGLLKTIKADHPSAKVKPLLVAPLLSSPLKFVDGTTPRVYQEGAVGDVISENFGILEAPTGSGKTVMGLMIILKLGLKALFVVHTKRLLQQTINELRTKFDIEPGVIGDGKFEIKDVTVAMVQTMLRRDMKPYCKEFGVVIFDECHHVPAKTFLELTKIFYAKHVYGLSATLEREDGLSWVLFKTIGPVLHKVNKKDLQAAGTILKPKVVPVNTPYKPTKSYDAFEVAQHINELAADILRNIFILNYIKTKLQPNISSVILTDRVNHVEYLAEELKAYKPVIYHGQLSKKDQEAAAIAMKNGKHNLTIATYTSIGEGFDVPVWEQLFLATPFSSTTRLIQVLGRISRAAKGKTAAIVHDFVDVKDPLLVDRYKKRLKGYATI